MKNLRLLAILLPVLLSGCLTTQFAPSSFEFPEGDIIERTAHVLHLPVTSDFIAAATLGRTRLVVNETMAPAVESSINDFFTTNSPFEETLIGDNELVAEDIYILMRPRKLYCESPYNVHYTMEIDLTVANGDGDLFYQDVLLVTAESGMTQQHAQNKALKKYFEFVNELLISIDYATPLDTDNREETLRLIKHGR